MHGHVCIYLNKHDGWNLQMEVGHRMCDLYRSLVSKRSQVSTQLVLFCSMATPAHVFGQKVAALAKDWNAEQLDKLHGAREFCRNASLLMGLNAMLGYIYICFLQQPHFRRYIRICEQSSRFCEIFALLEIAFNIYR